MHPTTDNDTKKFLVTDFYQGRGDNPKQIFVATPYKEAFTFDDRYADRTYFTRQEGKYSDYCYIKPLKLFNDNGMRLVKILWMPYREEYVERLISAQEEFYQSNEEFFTNPYLMIPLRVTKRTEITGSKSAAGISNTLFSGVPSLFSHYQIYMHLKTIFKGLGIHTFMYYEVDKNGKLGKNYVVQFHNIP